MIAFVVLLTGAGASLATAAVTRHAVRSPVFGPDHKVVICHFNNGHGGSFTEVDVDVASIVKGTGHGAHRNDIIPPFDYNIGAGLQHYPGRNYDTHVLGSNTLTGQQVLKNGCSVPTPPSGSIKVFALCVDVNHAAGTYEAVFGYISNLTATATVPAGSTENAFSPGAANRGQPSMFENGEVSAAVTVPDIPISEDLTWSVTFSGTTSKATATAADGAGIVSCDEQPPPDPDFPIGVFVTCVVNHGSTYDAQFGYESENIDAETIEVGESNFFSPGDENRGQPTTFLPGRNEDAVTVTGIPSSEELTWTLAWTDTVRAIATAGFAEKCPEVAPPPPPPPGTPTLPIGVFAACVTNHGSTYDATFGYVNDNVDVVTVPIGSDNAISPGPVGQGQPETFHPGFLNRAFTVTGVSASHAVTWTVIVGGEPRVATVHAGFPDKCVDAPIDPVANAHVTKTATPRTVKVGHAVTFTIDVRNTGSKVLQPAEVTDTLPANLLRGVSGTSTLGSCSVTTSGGSHRVHCTAPALAPGQSFTIHVTAHARASGTARDHAAVVGVPHATATAAVHITRTGRPPHPHPPPPAVTG